MADLKDILNIFITDLRLSLIPEKIDLKEITKLINIILEESAQNAISAGIVRPALNSVLLNNPILTENNTNNYIINPISAHVAEKIYTAGKVATIAYLDPEFREDVLTGFNLK